MTDRIETLRAELASETGEAKTVEIEVLRELLERGDKLAAAVRRYFYVSSGEPDIQNPRGIDRARREEFAALLQIQTALKEFEAGSYNPSPWRDIETAPRDGTPLFFFDPNSDWRGAVVVGYVEDNERRGLEFWDATGSYTFSPSHWMPLPTPPQPKEPPK